MTVLKARLGGDNHVAVVLAPYAPNVYCEGADVPFSREACSAIERGMQADERPRVFGDERSDPQVDEPIPYELLSSESIHSAMPACDRLG